MLLWIAFTTIQAKNIEVDIKNRSLVNDAAPIPSQCYTKTKDKKGRVHNPCFNCHISSKEPNYMDDWDLQTHYNFPEYARKNHWTNLFRDKTKEVSKIGDNEILAYIRKSNYIGEDGRLSLAEKLTNLPKKWDIDGDGKWDGYVPDCYFNFDTEGFDRDKKGKQTGWRAFGYTPFLGTFWTTNGSTDDVLIRLPMDFRMNKEGHFDKETYKVNLWIVEALIKQKSIHTDKIDEKKFGVDLNKDGKLSTARKITFAYDPARGKTMSYVGLAKQKGYKIAAGLYPKGTEFLHTVRYIDIDKDGAKMAPRMKELRYGKKVGWATYMDHQAVLEEELKERHDFPDRLSVYIGDAERGVSNKRGWRYQGFIEDKNGELRPQSYEENLFCIGCHSNLGALTDSTFVYQRKLERGIFQDGWFHWTQKDFKGIKEPKTPEGRYEYTLYLNENHAGDEFRSNDEVKKRFFDKKGRLKKSEVNKLHQDISHLLLPSQKRALELNKAYKVIVEEQGFVYGRDATIKPLETVYRKLKEGQTTGIDEPVRYDK